MKKFLFTLIICFGLPVLVNAQCYLQKFSNTIVQITDTMPMGLNKCQLTLNISFDMEYNDGAKYLYITSYLNSDYNNLAISNPLDFDCGNPSTPAKDMPTSTRLGTAVDQPGKSFLDIGFDLSPTRPNPGDPPAPVTLLTTYFPDATVVLYHNNISVPDGYTPGLMVTRENIGGDVGHFVITGLKVIVNKACNETIGVRTDVFASNASTATKAQCYDCGSLQFFNDPNASGAKLCSQPERQYTLDITTVDPSSRDITYKVYIDMNNDGKLNLPADILAFTSATISISSTNPYSTGGPVSVGPPYSNSHPYSEKGYLILIEGPLLPNSLLYNFPHPPGCVGLPVELVSFSATREKSSVILKWQTSLETNNAGFKIDRFSNGLWKEIGFVPSKALNGNSTELLSYSYTDLNNSRKITQYRIRQVDIDGRENFSIIRSVRGTGQSAKIIVYPNPGISGQVNVLLVDSDFSRRIFLADVNGRIIRQWNRFSGNNLQITGLVPGMYILRVINAETGRHHSKKIIIQ